MGAARHRLHDPRHLGDPLGIGLPHPRPDPLPAFRIRHPFLQRGVLFRPEVQAGKVGVEDPHRVSVPRDVGDGTGVVAPRAEGDVLAAHDGMPGPCRHAEPPAGFAPRPDLMDLNRRLFHAPHGAAHRALHRESRRIRIPVVLLKTEHVRALASNRLRDALLGVFAQPSIPVIEPNVPPHDLQGWSVVRQRLRHTPTESAPHAPVQIARKQNQQGKAQEPPPAAAAEHHGHRHDQKHTEHGERQTGQSRDRPAGRRQKDGEVGPQDAKSGKQAEYHPEVAPPSLGWAPRHAQTLLPWRKRKSFSSLVSWS